MWQLMLSKLSDASGLRCSILTYPFSIQPQSLLIPEYRLIRYFYVDLLKVVFYFNFFIVMSNNVSSFQEDDWIDDLSEIQNELDQTEIEEIEYLCRDYLQGEIIPGSFKL